MNRSFIFRVKIDRQVYSRILKNRKYIQAKRKKSVYKYKSKQITPTCVPTCALWKKSYIHPHCREVLKKKKSLSRYIELHGKESFVAKSDSRTFLNKGKKDIQSRNKFEQILI